MNALRLTLLMGFMTLFLVFVGRFLGGPQGMLTALMIAAAMNLGTYWFSDKLILSMYRAREVTSQDDPQLLAMVRVLAKKASLPMPKVYVIPDYSPNAFATGRDEHHAAIAVTQGILQLLSQEELAGVIGHELGHIRNQDMLIGTIAATFAGAISMLANMAQWNMIFRGSRDNGNESGPSGILMMIFAPIAASLIQMAISRSREYLADETGARLCQNPLYLASALRKLHEGVAQVPLTQAPPATAHLFIVFPFSPSGMLNLFSTHPPVEERIRRLEALSTKGKSA